LRYRLLPTSAVWTISAEAVTGDLSRAVLVLAAGTTSTGAIDPLTLAGRTAWKQVDAAWDGPLRLSKRYSARLDGIERADSVSVSAHKLLFHPKEPGLTLFQDAKTAHVALSFGGGYLATPNVGLLGSHGAVAVPLLATLMAYCRDGMVRRIEHCMALGDWLSTFIAADARLEVLQSRRQASRFGDRRKSSGLTWFWPVSLRKALR
jgi:L-2,4-diaminobutyrate decarboxylase